MYKTFEMELAGRPLKVDVGRVAKQANGAVLMHYGDTTVLCTATASEKPRDGIDFFPLSVEYNERMYAVGKENMFFHYTRCRRSSFTINKNHNYECRTWTCSRNY